jgi:hypothetical protein
MQFYFFVVSLIVAAVHLCRDRKPRTGARVAVSPGLSEKGASDALSVDLAGIRRPKWAEKHCFGCP